MSDFETRWRELISGGNPAWWAPAAQGGLRLLSYLYGAGTVGYRSGFDLGLLRRYELPCKVVAVGNLTVGGTGKTTTVRWLVRRLAEWGLRPAVLSYGYRAGSKDAVTVVSGPEGVREPVEVSGDEAQLLARSLPGVPLLIGKRRYRSGNRAWDEFRPDVCVLDDGFQYWRLKKDLEIVLLNAMNPFGYGYMLPRGMLREPPDALRRADVAILTHAAWASEAERERTREAVLKWNPGVVLGEARHRPSRLREHGGGAEVPVLELRTGRWLALSSLGQPESFERTLADLGATPPVLARFRDHHPYSEADLEGICRQVTGEGLAGIVTTEKDAVKIPSGWLRGTRCLVLEVDLELLYGEDVIERVLRQRLGDGA